MNTLIVVAVSFVVGVTCGFYYRRYIGHWLVRLINAAATRLPSRCQVDECKKTEPRWYEREAALSGDAEGSFLICSSCVIRVANGQTLHYKGKDIDPGKAVFKVVDTNKPQVDTSAKDYK